MSKKKYRLIVINTLCLLFLMMSAQRSDGVEGAYTTNGQMLFSPGTGPVAPYDPLNPDPDVPVAPIDPTMPGGTPAPGTAGPLSIDFASGIDFGLHAISNQDQTYYARAQQFTDLSDRPNYIQVTDNRGTSQGWVLKVKQNGPLLSVVSTTHEELIGAQITLNNTTIESYSDAIFPSAASGAIPLDAQGGESVIMSAASGSGLGTWECSWGIVEEITETDSTGQPVPVNVTKAIALAVPGVTPKDPVNYQTQLVWSLNDIPVNE